MENLEQRFPEAALVKGDREDRATLQEVIAYVKDPRRKLDAPLDLRGTEFQVKAWLAVRDVPPGTTATYRDIAEKIGAPRAMRAVGSACANNKLAMVIPCHRILRSDGSMAGGVDWCGVGQEELIRREAP
jgi:AraC family transcriptional regulator of adaptative response/methylated-DNA-[protein]-cysteine methyltransferase